MLKNYFITALRNIIKNKFYSILNIMGLAIGIVCSILILLFVREEVTYDKHYKNWEHIYRLESNFTFSGTESNFAQVAIPLLPAMKTEYPEIKGITRFGSFGASNVLFQYNDIRFPESNIYFADSTVFKIFNYEFIYGAPDNALNEPNTILLTQSFASKYFGRKNPLGELITTDKYGSCRVTGVIKDLPANSHLRFDCLISMATMIKIAGADRFNSTAGYMFWNISLFGYIILNDNSKIEDLLVKFPRFYDKYMSSVGKQVDGAFKLTATRLDKVHFSSGLQSDLPVGNYTYIIIFSLVGIFMLLIASLNYMNMATARSANRSIEVALRKVAGAGRGTLIRQFLGESMILIIAAFLIAVIATLFFLPSFNILTGKSLNLGDLFEPVTISIILLIPILVGFVSGSYPALFLSSFTPVDILKSNLNPHHGKSVLRKILVVFQFAVSGILIICTIVVSGQQRFIKNKDLGLNKENVMIIPVTDTALLRHGMQSFKDELLKLPDIQGVSSSVMAPPELVGRYVFLIEKDSSMPKITTCFTIVDHDFLDVMQIKLVKGRNFDRTVTSDPDKAFIVNEEAVKAFGWGDSPIGKKIRFGIDPSTNLSLQSGEVIGVVKDFHFTSIHNQIEPIILMVRKNPSANFYLRLGDRNIPAMIESIKKVRQNIGTTLPFRYFFFSDKLDEMYIAENKLNTLFNIFSVITIFIACLGLMGLTSFVTEQRSKETSLRKIMGAGIGQLIWLVNKDFLLLVLISNLISWPIAWLFMDKWIHRFAYHIDFGLSPFIPATAVSFMISLLLTLAIAVITVSSVSIRGAYTNPIDTLSSQ
jgi:putative ABC transport system permease protein